MECPFCGSNSLELIADFNMLKYVSTNLPLNNCEVHVRVEYCNSCGLGLNTTPLSSIELETIYEHYCCPNSYFEGIGQEHFKQLDINFIKKHIPSLDSKVVEIGCNDGHLLDLLQKSNITGGGEYKYLMGIEPSNDAKIGIAHGLNIEKAFFRKGYFKDNVDFLF